MPESVGSPALWTGFTLFVLALLVLDLGVFHRKSHAVSIREAALWCAVWVGLAALFNLGVFLKFGRQRGLEFLTGYLIELALSIDNLFVFIVVFSYFACPPAQQHRVLFWGIVGALVMRAGFILAGSALLSAFHWIVYLFGGFLVLTGIKILLQKSEEVHPERNPVVRLVERVFPLTPRYHGQRFFVREGGKLAATPLFLILAVIETTDLVFAVDSVPAIFAVTRDSFIVYTSNIFAILGLRSLYFLLAGVMGSFRFLKYGLGLVLAFVGVKMVIADIFHIPIGISLGVVAGLLGGAVGLSLAWPAADDRERKKA